MVDIEERLKESFIALQTLKATQAVDLLRARADMADVIEEAHKEGLTNYRIARLLKTDRTAIGRMSRGIWMPPGTAVRSLDAQLAEGGLVAVPRPAVPETASDAAEAHRAAENWKRVPRPKLQCRYCSDQAAYAINMADGRSILVCTKHKPKER